MGGVPCEGPLLVCFCVHIPFGCLGISYSPSWAQGMGLGAHEIGEERRWEKQLIFLGFPGGAVVENLPANAEDTGLSPGLGRSHMPRSN